MLTIQFQVESKDTTGMAEKRGDLTGFDGIQGSHTAKRLKDWGKNQPETLSPCYFGNLLKFMSEIQKSTK